jgi:hypothetical protein
VHFKGTEFASRWWGKVLAWITSAIIIALNGKLVHGQVEGWVVGGAPLLVLILMVSIVVAFSLFLLYHIIFPLLRGDRSWREEKPGGALASIKGHACRRGSCQATGCWVIFYGNKRRILYVTKMIFLFWGYDEEKYSYLLKGERVEGRD